MSACCSSASRMFGKGQARRDARRYERKGLDKTARRMVDHLAARGLEGAQVLEVGGGVGAVEIELLQAGAAHALNVELSDGYDDQAARLVAERGLEGRVERRIDDFVERADEIEPADVVVLHRVVCCYPDEEALVGAASGHTRRLLAMSFPRDRLFLRLGARLGNVILRRLFDFQVYIRPSEAVLAPAEAGGLRVVTEHQGAIWRFAVLERL